MVFLEAQQRLDPLFFRKGPRYSERGGRPLQKRQSEHPGQRKEEKPGRKKEGLAEAPWGLR